MHYFKLQSLASVLLVLVVPATLVAVEHWQDKGKPDKPKNEKHEDRDDTRQTEEGVLLSAGIRISYKDARQYAVGSNLTGQKALPPGIRKNLARGKPIPPGISQTRLPSSFLTKLPASEGYEWQVAGVDLVLVFKADKLISDVLKDVFR